MDSITQMALGAAVGEAVLGRRIGNRAPLWGAVLGTLPDLDVLVPLGGPVADFTWHRSYSHSLIVLALVSPLIARVLWRMPRPDNPPFRLWWWMVFLVLMTHPLLDAFTVYGTQLLWPLDSTPVSWSTLFIIDPAYTLPLLGGVLGTLLLVRPGASRPWRLNAAGLVLSTLYIGWSVLAKQMIEADARASLAAQGLPTEPLLSTPAPFNTLLWRVLVMDGDRYLEGFDSLVDGDTRLRTVAYPHRPELLEGIEDHWPVRRLGWFTHGFRSVSPEGDEVLITDLRMGVEPSYVFRFRVGLREDGRTIPVPAAQRASSYDADRLGLLWERIWRSDIDLAP